MEIITHLTKALSRLDLPKDAAQAMALVKIAKMSIEVEESHISLGKTTIAYLETQLLEDIRRHEESNSNSRPHLWEDESIPGEWKWTSRPKPDVERATPADYTLCPQAASGTISLEELGRNGVQRGE